MKNRNWKLIPLALVSAAFIAVGPAIVLALPSATATVAFAPTAERPPPTAYKADLRPAVLVNALGMLKKQPEDRLRWLRNHFARGERIILKFHDSDVRRDISAVWFGIDSDVRALILQVGKEHMASGGTVEIFTVSEHGDIFDPADIRGPCDPRNPETWASFMQSALRYVWDADFTPRIWMGNGSHAPSRNKPADHRVPTLMTAVTCKSFGSGVTIGCEALGLDDGEWDQELLHNTPLIASSHYLLTRDPDRTLVVPAGLVVEVHHVVKNWPDHWTDEQLEEFVEHYRGAGFVTSSGSKGADKFKELEDG